MGAVTGNPRIRNRSSLLGRLQVGEFSSIIGMIKRAQRTYGRLFTVSGAVCAFRRTALHRIGYWSDTIVTEAIDISWRLQMDDWDVRFEPRARVRSSCRDPVRAVATTDAVGPGRGAYPRWPTPRGGHLAAAAGCGRCCEYQSSVPGRSSLVALAG